MSDTTVHLIKVPFRAEKLTAIARQRGLRLRDLDEGYLTHCVLRELWQHEAPAPFVVRGRGRTLDVWGYSSADAARLIAHAQTYGDPSLLGVVADVQTVASRPMPRLTAGRRVGFLLRACPVVRIPRGSTTFRPGAEIDVFVTRCRAAGEDASLSREAVYREWLIERLQRPETGVSPESVRVASYARERVVRRTQGVERRAHNFERPDVRFEGDLTIVDGALFNRWLAHGVGRHRAFGFGAMLLVPPGTTHAASPERRC